MEGSCPKCGAPLVRQTDRRKARGYSLRCSVGGHPAAGTPRSRRAKARVGAQRWLTDPSVKACPRDGCHFDLGSCGHARKGPHLAA